MQIAWCPIKEQTLNLDLSSIVNWTYAASRARGCAAAGVCVSAYPTPISPNICAQMHNTSPNICASMHNTSPVTVHKCTSLSHPL